MLIVKHFSFRRYSEKTLLTIVEVVADNDDGKNGAGLGFRELKWKTERALNHTLHPSTIHKYLDDILVDGKILTKRKGHARGSKVDYRLTKEARQELKAGVLRIDSIKSAKEEDLFADEKERFRLYNLLFTIDTIDNPIHELYDTEEGIIGTISKLAQIQISAKDLIPIRVGIEEVNCVVTYYKPFSCIALMKREYYPDTRSHDDAVSTALDDIAAASDVTVGAKGLLSYPRQNKNNEQKFAYYYLKLEGISISDILARNHKYYTTKGFDLIKLSILHECLTKAKVKKGIRLLEEAKIIKRIGSLLGETRYSFVDDSLRLLIGDCLKVFKFTIWDALPKVWELERKVNSEERAWLERIYGPKQARRIISDCYDSLRINREIETLDRQQHEKEFWYKFISKEVKNIKEGYYPETNNNKIAASSLIQRYPFPLQFLIDEMICPSFLGESLGIKKRK